MQLPREFHKNGWTIARDNSLKSKKTSQRKEEEQDGHYYIIYMQNIKQYVESKRKKYIEEG